MNPDEVGLNYTVNTNLRVSQDVIQLIVNDNDIIAGNSYAIVKKNDTARRIIDTQTATDNCEVRYTTHIDHGKLVLMTGVTYEIYQSPVDFEHDSPVAEFTYEPSGRHAIYSAGILDNSLVSGAYMSDYEDAADNAKGFLSHDVIWWIGQDGRTDVHGEELTGLFIAPANGVSGTLSNNQRWYKQSGTNYDLNIWADDIEDILDFAVIKPGVNAIGNIDYLFQRLSMQEIDLSGLNTTNVTSMRNTFAGTGLKTIDVSQLDVQNVVCFASMFANNRHLQSLDVSGWDTGKGEDFQWMFGWMSNITTISGLNTWNMENAKNLSYMFQHSQLLSSINVSNWNISKVNYMTAMFGNTGFTDLDLSGWNTRNVLNMAGMFYQCAQLTALTLGPNWNTSHVTSMYDGRASGGMFQGCSSLTLNCSAWDVSSNVDNESDRVYFNLDAPGVTAPTWATL